MTGARPAHTWSIDELNAALAVAYEPPRPACEPTPGALEPSCSTCFPCQDMGQEVRLDPPVVNDDKSPRCRVRSKSDTLTNPKYMFLREVGGPNCLKRFLDSVIAAGEHGPHWGATLVIDTEVPLNFPITIPAFFTLAGVGINGGGRLKFAGDFGGIPAVSFQAFSSVTGTIRDLAIIGPGAKSKLSGVKVGIIKSVPDGMLNAPTDFRLQRVRVSGFGVYGVQGGINTSSVILDACQVLDNRVNIELVRGCDGWRIRDCIITGATEWGVDVAVTISIAGVKHTGTVTDTLISGCRFEGNGTGAIRVQPGDAKKPVFGVSIFGNGFVNNAGVALRVQPANAAVRFVANFLGPGEEIVLDSGQNLAMGKPASHDVHIGFNASRKDNVLNTLKASS